MKLTEIIKNLITNFTDHTTSPNPHGVTAEQVGADPAGAAAAVAGDLGSHAGRTDNPHGVTAEQVGLPPEVINSPEWIDVGPSGFLAGRYYFAGLQDGKPVYKRPIDDVSIAYSPAEEWYMIFALGPEGGWWRETNGAQEPEDITGFIPESPEATGEYDAVLTSKLPRELIRYYAGTL